MVELSVIMPCHNEGHTIKQNIDETIDTLKRANNGSFELILIDDGSLDKTFEEIKAGAQNNGGVKYLKLEENHGKGHALREGFEYANGKHICFLDGDLDLHPRMIPVFLEHMKNENADVVIGSKRHPQSNVNYPMNRRILSMGYQGFIKMMFGMSIRDSQVGLKLFKKKVLEDVFPNVLVKEYAFDIEVLVNAHNRGYKIVEAPIEMDFINVVGSDMDLRAVSRMFVDTCAIFYRSNLLHSYDEGPGISQEGGAYLLKRR